MFFVICVERKQSFARNILFATRTSQQLLDSHMIFSELRVFFYHCKALLIGKCGELVFEVPIETVNTLVIRYFSSLVLEFET